MIAQRLRRALAPLAAVPHVWQASRIPFILLSVFLLAQGVVGPLAALLLGETVGTYSDGNFGEELPRLAILWALLTGSSLLTFPVVYSLSGRLNEDLTTYLQDLLLRRGSSLQTMQLFDDPDAYDVISLVVRESKSRPVNYIVLYSYILRGTVSLASFGVILWAFAWYIPVLLVVAAVPLHHAFTAMRESNWTGIRQRAQTARFLDYMVGLFLNRDTAMETRAHDLRDVIRERFDSDRSEMLADLRHHRHKGLVSNLPGLAVGVVIYVAAIVLLLVNADSTALAVAGLTAGLQAFSAMQQAVSEVVENLSYLNEKAFFFRDLNRLLAFRETTLPSASSAPDEGENEPALIDDDRVESPVLEFRRASFVYPSSSVPAVKDISFSLNRGETLAIVGKNGAGKSTLVKLACGFYGPTAGTVRVDGDVLTGDRVDLWRESISPIFQSTTAFAMSFEENLKLGTTASTKRVNAALKVAYGDEPPRMLEESLGVEFGGSELSGGELQRLGLARAVVRGRQVVVLDEPTSAIDPLFEAEVFASIQEFVRDRTAVIITHRMPQALTADKVLVMENGAVVEYGAPQVLFDQGGIFAAMVNAQSALFTKGG